MSSTTNEQPVEAGSVVQLRSGGPVMTVESIMGGIAKCVYYGPTHMRYDQPHAVVAIRVVRLPEPVQP